ncbi:hypothetical protein [Variovorax sp. J31P179]|uniref:hypothetical protein n=1 Tax=Variovorax sp. J31P179 TaxID=3053508 RepID=UPI002578BDDB|nr:hypothetical protein [Variovorax sp. J31P179]
MDQEEEDEDDDPVGCPPVRDPVREFRAAAEASGLIWQGDPLDQKLIDFAHRVVERCACIAESFVDDRDHSAADAIRSELGEH